MLKDIVKTHSNTIPTLAKGFVECRRYIGAEEVGHVLERHLRARIGTRLLAEQHIALHEASVGKNPIEEKQNEDQHEYIGTIDTNMLPAKIIQSCAAFVGDICELRYGVRPRLIIDGHVNEKFPYIPVHLEYIVTELLKNAFRATIESPTFSKAQNDSTSRLTEDGDHNLPPVIVTLAVSEREHPDPDSSGSDSDSDGDNEGRNPVGETEKILTIRIRDRGGGIAPEVMPSIWKYSFTTFDPDKGRYYSPSSSSSTSTPSSTLNSEAGAYSNVANITGTTDDINPMNINLGLGGGHGIMPIVDALNITSDIGGGAGGAAGAGGGSSIAGLGYGLPLSRAYAEYFGGSLSLQSCFGWGTDVYLVLKGAGGV